MLRVKTGCGACGASAPDDANFCPRCGVVLGEGRNPFRALIEATRLVAADAGRDLDATLDTLTEQARRLLGADSAALQLAVGEDELEVRRPGHQVAPGTPFATPGTRYRPGRFTGEAVAVRRPI